MSKLAHYGQTTEKHKRIAVATLSKEDRVRPTQAVIEHRATATGNMH